MHHATLQGESSFGGAREGKGGGGYVGGGCVGSCVDGCVDCGGSFFCGCVGGDGGCVGGYVDCGGENNGCGGCCDESSDCETMVVEVVM